MIENIWTSSSQEVNSSFNRLSSCFYDIGSPLIHIWTILLRVLLTKGRQKSKISVDFEFIEEIMKKKLMLVLRLKIYTWQRVLINLIVLFFGGLGKFEKPKCGL